jgi:nitroreductase
MDFLKLARERYSVRSFEKRPVSDGELRAILEAGRCAPTARNFQPQKIFVAKSKESLDTLKNVCRFTFDAPTVLVIGYDKERSWKNKLMPPYDSGETDAAIVATHMMLMAASLGIGTCWVGYFNADDVRKALSLPENVVITALMPIGYPAKDSVPADFHTQTRELADTVEEI